MEFDEILKRLIIFTTYQNFIRFQSALRVGETKFFDFFYRGIRNKKCCKAWGAQRYFFRTGQKSRKGGGRTATPPPWVKGLNFSYPDQDSSLF